MSKVDYYIDKSSPFGEIHYWAKVDRVWYLATSTSHWEYIVWPGRVDPIQFYKLEPLSRLEVLIRDLPRYKNGKEGDKR